MRLETVPSRLTVFYLRKDLIVASYQEVIEGALNAYIGPIREIERIVDGAIRRIVHERQVETIEEAIGALNAIIESLINEFPDKGFVAWTPPKGDSPVGERWEEALQTLYEVWAEEGRASTA